MWFVGLVIGMLLGGFTGSGGGVLVGGILGLAGGLIYGELSRGRNRPLEERVDALEKNVKQLSAQIAALKAGQQPGREMSVEISENPSSIEPVETPAFSRAILPVVSESHAPAPPEKIRPKIFQPDQRYPEAAPARNILEEHEWLANLFKGNILAKVGVIILFFGIASGLKLAVDMGLFPISVRLTLGAFAAIALSVFGYHSAQHPEHRMFGLAMQGGGLGVLYLLVYFMLGR